MIQGKNLQNIGKIKNVGSLSQRSFQQIGNQDGKKILSAKERKDGALPQPLKALQHNVLVICQFIKSL